MNIAVIITTYQRNDGKTPFYLKRALDSVFNQTHKDFKIFLIGDRYNDNSEFLDIVSNYDLNKIHFENLPVAMERDKYTNKDLIWKYGGCNASNHAINTAVSNGYDYICRLDHDDHWEINHLEVINEVIEKYNPLFICTKSTYPSSVLPKFESNEYLIETYPIFGGVVHSSTCVKYGAIPLRQVNLYEEYGTPTVPGDAYFWNILKAYMMERNEIGYCINLVTCLHDEEQFEKNNLE
jgi:glycosyltransferase involved in cell wall biosynthesis